MSSVAHVWPDRGERKWHGVRLQDEPFWRSFRLVKIAVTVVISQTHLPDGHTWKDLLHDLQRTPDPPLLVVADRLAGDRLWAEVLNLGAYDLLMTPFESKEVLRTVNMRVNAESTSQILARRGETRSDPRPAAFPNGLCHDSSLIHAVERARCPMWRAIDRVWRTLECPLPKRSLKAAPAR